MALPNLVKGGIALVFSGLIGAAAVTMGILGVTAEAKQWCEIPCLNMTQRCDLRDGLTPSPSLTCAVVRTTLQEYRKTNGQDGTKYFRGRRIWWEHTPDGTFKDHWGRDNLTGLGGWKVGIQPGEKPCTTALKHELWHVLLRVFRGTVDGAHLHPSWTTTADKATGCLKDDALPPKKRGTR